MEVVRVNSALLNWAILRSGRSQAEIKHYFPKIEQWLKENTGPTFKQLEKFANLTYTPLGFFFLKEPPIEELPIPFYRTTDGQPFLREPSANLIETMQTMQSRQNWMREYLVEQGESPLNIVKSVNINDSEVEIAKEIKNRLKLGSDWASKHNTWTEALRYLRDAIDAMGILVVFNGIVGNNTHRKLDPQEFRGFVLVDEYAPLLFVNGADGKAAQMFTLAHELAHVFLGYSAAFDLRNSMPSENVTEKLCDKVAAEFLVPATEFCKQWENVNNYTNKFQHLAKIFKVSEIVIARRALDLKFINRSEFFEFYENYLSQEHKAKTNQTGGGDFYANQKYRIGKKFAESVIVATLEGSLLYSEAYRLTGLRGKTFDDFVSSTGYGGYRG